ncbi:hypothetical protein B0H21DRAFT_779427 [Amylocystis lapponica]|nr:hypothetical protein B0H21DRAFT_779427 [Amylocystis lapponica]
MLRTLTKLPLRRSLHTHASSFGAILGAGAAVTTYFAWKASHGESISLDSVASSSKQVPLARKPAVSPETLTNSSPSVAHEPTQDSLQPLAEEFSASATTVEGEIEAEAEGEGDHGGGGGGAYDPVTGEINWDCPCLGGMAHGPCGLQFREAFSCFVYSEKEPKGIDCVEKFKAMQDCFREHPDVYGDGARDTVLGLETSVLMVCAEIMDDDDEDDPVAVPAPSADSPVDSQTSDAVVPSTPEPRTSSSVPTNKSKPRADSPSSP